MQHFAKIYIKILYLFRIFVFRLFLSEYPITITINEKPNQNHSTQEITFGFFIEVKRMHQQ